LREKKLILRQKWQLKRVPQFSLTLPLSLTL
jgi:hypothetical protein